MTESPELTTAREQYAAALHADRTRRAAQDRLTQLRMDAEHARSRLSRAQTALRMEHDEAEEWASRGFAQLALWIIGKLDDRRDLEARQVVEAAVRVADATAEVAAFDAAIAAAAAALPAAGAVSVEGAEAALRAALMANDPGTTDRIQQLETDAADAAAQIQEVDEARRAVARCVSVLDQASSSLSSAHSWGTYDTWFGGGALASIAKRNRVEEALQHIDVAAGALRELRHELADVKARVEVSAGLEVPSGAWTFDVWFDNFFSDAKMQDRIATTDASVANLRSELGRVGGALDAYRQQLVDGASSLRQHASALLAAG